MPNISRQDIEVLKGQIEYYRQKKATVERRASHAVKYAEQHALARQAETFGVRGEALGRILSAITGQSSVSKERPAPATTKVELSKADLSALRRLQNAKPLGCTRAAGGWDSIAGHVSIETGRTLSALGLARVDYGGRYPRLKITAAGNQLLTQRETSVSVPIGGQ